MLPAFRVLPERERSVIAGLCPSCYSEGAGEISEGTGTEKARDKASHSPEGGEDDEICQNALCSWDRDRSVRGIVIVPAGAGV